MKIVVNHLTRMQHGYICVAGLDPDTGQHVRPIPEDDRWRRPHLVGQAGPFDIASVVDLGRAGYVGRAPQIEDYRVRPTKARRLEDLSPAAFWRLLKDASRARLSDIFGADLQPVGSSYAVEEGKGVASLGCLLLDCPPALRITPGGDIRLNFSHHSQAPSLKVTDLRLYAGNPMAPRPDVIQCLSERMARGVGVVLSVGLSRAWLKPGDVVARHWLQVNNIHLEDDPVWPQRPR